MARLIDETEVEKILRVYADDVGCNRGEYELANGILKAVGKLRDVPTAYDVEKVVEEIKEYSIRTFGEIRTENVIEIVRKGGAE